MMEMHEHDEMRWAAQFATNTSYSGPIDYIKSFD